MKYIPSLLIITGGFLLTIAHLKARTLPIGSILITIAGVAFLVMHIKEKNK